MAVTSLPRPARTLALSFDAGGAFTDFALVDLASRAIVAEHKVPTDPHDPRTALPAGLGLPAASGPLAEPTSSRGRCSG
jgi:N-methylhydantoinase A/oxoprolinase/acetone carboxylase beta subunit